MLLLLVQELHNTGAAYTEASASNEDLQEESKQLRRQLKSSMALNEKVQAELQRVTDIEAEKYAGDKADRTAAYFELESTLHKTRAEKTKLVRENKQLQRHPQRRPPAARRFFRAWAAASEQQGRCQAAPQGSQ